MGPASRQIKVLPNKASRTALARTASPGISSRSLATARDVEQTTVSRIYLDKFWPQGPDRGPTPTPSGVDTGHCRRKMLALASCCSTAFTGLATVRPTHPHTHTAAPNAARATSLVPPMHWRQCTPSDPLLALLCAGAGQGPGRAYLGLLVWGHRNYCDTNVGPDLRCGAQLPADTGPFSQTALSSTPVARRYLHLCLYVVRVRQ